MNDDKKDVEEVIDSTGRHEQPSPSKNEQPEASAKRKVDVAWKDVPDEKNTSVYVSGLPTTIKEEEFVDLMRKYGIIAKKPIQGSPLNIKLYRHRDGSLKGDGCCKYARKESVDLAIEYLDEMQYDDKHVIRCEKAKFEPKNSFDPSKKPRIDPKALMKQRKQTEKILSWETETPPELKQKKVVLKNMFTIEELTNDASLILKIRDDLEQRCAREIAEPKRVEVFDTNPDGVISITFAEPEQAQACVHAFKPYFNVELWDGKTKYKIKETDEETEKRLKKFERDIENSDQPHNELVNTETSEASPTSTT